MLVTKKPTFPSNSALGEALRVKLSGGYLVVAAANEDELGTLEQRVLSTDLSAAVLPLDEAGVRHFVASEAISDGQAFYAAAGGKVATSGTLLRGVAMEAASGNNSVFKGLAARSSITGTVARANIVEDALQSYPIKVTDYRVWDAPQTNAVGTPANDDLGVVYNTFLTAGPSLETGDLKNAGSTSRKVGFQFTVPPEYVAGQDITLRLNAGAKTTVASTALTIDAEVARQAAPTVDICATAAQSINNLTAANKDFTITPTNVVPGDVLDVVLTVLVNDTGTGTAVIGKLYKAEFLLDVKG